MTVVWKVPSHWREASLCDRASLYPALYLQRAGRQVWLTRELAGAGFGRHDALVVVSDGPLSAEDRVALEANAGRIPTLLIPQAGVVAADQEFVRQTGLAVLRAGEAAGPPGAGRPRLGRGVRMTGCAARLAEDGVLAGMLGWPASTADSDFIDSIVVIAETPAGVARVDRALRRQKMDCDRLVIVVPAEPDDGFLAVVQGRRLLAASDPRLLATLAGARLVVCDHEDAPVDSPRPGQWVRTALFHGVPVIAASHASLDELDSLCVIDDWERGLAIYERLPTQRARAAARAQAFLRTRLDPALIGQAWLDLLAPLPRRRKAQSEPASREAPVLLVLFDLGQDADLLVPVLEAVKARRNVELRIVVTDWLVSESGRTLSMLSDAGLSFEIVPRGAVRMGQSPSLCRVAGVLTAADTNLGPHRSGHKLAERARQNGLQAFTMQHGLENVGLNYRDQVHGGEVQLASNHIFTWGPKTSLPAWLDRKTLDRIQAVGSPKRTVPVEGSLPLSKRSWAKVVGVFENLHWHRYSEFYRSRFIADLTEFARRHPDVLTVIKPHHAGRWIIANGDAIQGGDNIKVIDPNDPAWHPYTAPVLIDQLDVVLTTPSTVALDAARAGRPVAVLGYDLDLPLYLPLPIVQDISDWDALLDETDGQHLARNEAFLRRNLIPGRSTHRIAARIEAALAVDPVVGGEDAESDSDTADGELRHQAAEGAAA